VLRHTAATRWLRARVDVVVVAEPLAHASPDTTRRYTLPTGRELAAAVETGAVEVLAEPSWFSV
jgi:integrase